MARRIIVKQSTAAELKEVLEWLKEYFENGSIFWLNHVTIENAHAAGGLMVALHPRSSKVVGFCVGDLVSGGGLFEIHPKFRRRGFGTAFVEHLRDKAARAKKPALWIQCVTPESVSFWRLQGFHVLKSENDNPPYAYLRIRPEFRLPANPKRVRFRIELLHESLDSTIYESEEIEGAEVGSGWYLAQRFVGYVPSGDARVKISRENNVFWCKKAKYSKEIGVHYDSSFVSIDRIALAPKSPPEKTLLPNA